MQIHASCVARDRAGVLLLGPPGSGKSDLALRLLDRGFMLVADDRVEIEDGIARPRRTSPGCWRCAGLGIVRLPHAAEAPLALAVRLGPPAERLPPPARDAELGLPVIALDPAAAVGRGPGGARARLRARPRRPGRGRIRMSGAQRRAAHRVVLVTGLSGAGKLSVLRALEDLGYAAVDNPPLPLVDGLVAEQVAGGAPDSRSASTRAPAASTPAPCSPTRERLRASPALRTELVYAWADDGVLMRRYTESRRRHPLAPEGRVRDGIAAEQALTGALREAADLVIDTSDLPLAGLRRLIEQRFARARPRP